MTKLDDLMAELTQRVIDAIENDLTGKWSKPWVTVLAGSQFPVNVTTEKHYKGMNALMGMLEQHEKGYDTSLWATYRQWQSIGGQVQKGQRGTHMVKWTPRYRCHTCDSKKDKNLCPSSHLVQRYMAGRAFSVFNYDQQEGYVHEELELDKPEEDPFKLADRFLTRTGAIIHRKISNDAYFDPINDEITLPLPEQFDTWAAFYGTAFHELTHWTGHKTRLKRLTHAGFGSKEYAEEELVAELGAIFHGSHLGVEIEPHMEHANYLASWLTTLKEHPRVLYRAASQAQAALEYTTELVGNMTTIEEVRA